MSIELRQAINALMIGMKESQLRELLRVARELVEHPGKGHLSPKDTL